MSYAISLEGISWKGLSMALGHSVISGMALILWQPGFRSDRILRYELGVISAVLLVIATVPLYIATGVPNVVRHNCRNCGELMNSGKAYCDNCGNKLQPNHGGQIIWFVLGYGTLMMVFGIISAAFIVNSVPNTEGISLGPGGFLIFAVILPTVGGYSLCLFVLYQISRYGYIIMKKKIST